MQILSILSENNEVSFIKEKNVFTIHESDDSPPSLMNMSSRTQLRTQLTAQLVVFQPDLREVKVEQVSTLFTVKAIQEFLLTFSFQLKHKKIVNFFVL